MDRTSDVISFIAKYFCFRKPRVVFFANIIKALIMFIRTTFKDLKKVRRIGNYVSKFNLQNAILYFLI